MLRQSLVLVCGGSGALLVDVEKSSYSVKSAGLVW